MAITSRLGSDRRSIVRTIRISLTCVTALRGNAIGDSYDIGLDGASTALFVALLAVQLRDRRRVAAAAGGAAIAALLTPFTSPGVPIIAATAAVVVGWRRA